jgi:hypothetical protein
MGTMEHEILAKLEKLLSNPLERECEHHMPEMQTKVCRTDGYGSSRIEDV